MAHPPQKIAAATHAATIEAPFLKNFCPITSGRLFVEQSVDVRDVLPVLFEKESVVHVTNFAVPSDQERCRHILEIVFVRDLAIRVVDDLKLRIVRPQEFVREAAIMIDVDGDHDQSLVSVGLLNVIHPRKGCPARRAPRRPEIEIYDFALIDAEIEVICPGGTCRVRIERRQKGQDRPCPKK